MKRDELHPKSYFLVGELQLRSVIEYINKMPIDHDNPIEVLIREKQKKRKPTQNDAMWAGTLRDISEQAYCQGNYYSAEMWHIYFKKKYLPEDFDPELCLDGYKKWALTPSGERELVGSTTKLTRKGFAEYILQIEAEAAEFGVIFTTLSVNPRHSRAVI